MTDRIDTQEKLRLNWSDVAWGTLILSGLGVELWAVLTRNTHHTLSHKVERFRDFLPPYGQWLYRVGLLGAAAWLVVHWAW